MTANFAFLPLSRFRDPDSRQAPLPADLTLVTAELSSATIYTFPTPPLPDSISRDPWPMARTLATERMVLRLSIQGCIR